MPSTERISSSARTRVAGSASSKSSGTSSTGTGLPLRRWLASTYPAVHNVRQAGDGGSWRLPRELPVLGELVAAAGLDPIAVTGNGFITDVAGYGRGFVEFRNMMRERMGESHLIIGTLFGKDVLAYALTRITAR